MHPIALVLAALIAAAPTTAEPAKKPKPKTEAAKPDAKAAPKPKADAAKPAAKADAGRPAAKADAAKPAAKADAGKPAAKADATRPAPKADAVTPKADAVTPKADAAKPVDTAPAVEPAKAEKPPVRPSLPDQTRPADAKESDRPWARGVSTQAQQQALVLFREANTLLRESVMIQAAAKYREALKYWDHPAIHYNLVLALLNMDQPLDVHEHLVEALKWGPEPLDRDKFEQAKSYKALVEKQLAQVNIHCDVTGAAVSMDGRPLFTGPGSWDGLARAGPHSIVANAEGYLTNEVSKSLPAGERTSVEIKLFTSSELTRYKRRWGTWVPWVVLAGGVAVAGGGGGLHYGAVQRFKSFDDGIIACGGCVPSSELESKRSSGFTLQKVAVGSYVAGGALIATGAVLLWLNRAMPYQVGAESAGEAAPGAPMPAPRPDPKPAGKDDPTWGLAPVIGPDQCGLVAAFRF